MIKVKNEVKNKISNITNLATTFALTSVENKILMLVIQSKNPDYNTNVNEIKKKMTTDHDLDKYITTQEFNKLTAEGFTVRLARKGDTANFVKKTGLNKNELNGLSKKAISTKGLTKDLINTFSNLNVAKQFFSGIFQNYLAFKPAKKNVIYFSGTTWIDSRKSNGMSEENIAPAFVDHHILPDINFNGHSLIKIIFPSLKK